MGVDGRGHLGASGQSKPEEKKPSSQDHLVRAPAITLPKGGGAIRGIDEKFSVNAATGTASLAVPIFTTPGRSGFHPQLSLSYDSGAGNGPFGLGWSLSVPAIARKTDKGVPRRDHEDWTPHPLRGRGLVPCCGGDTTGREILRPGTRLRRYPVERYRLRIEALRQDRALVHRTGDTLAGDHAGQRHRLYGRTAESRSRTRLIPLAP
jgi:hypothetical protein